jgi:hypothetical protein
MSNDTGTTDPAVRNALLLLVEQHGQRDIMSGARKASLTITLDPGHEMVVTATIHDRRRERIIAIGATAMAVVATMIAIIVISPALLQLAKVLTNAT